MEIYGVKDPKNNRNEKLIRPTNIYLILSKKYISEV